MNERKIVIPGEVIVSGDNYLPGESTEKRGNDIVALKYGLAEESNKLVKIIPLSGPYIPRRGNVVIGKVELITHNGWVINIGCAENGFLSVMEVPRYVNKDAMDEVMSIGDMAVVKIWSMNGRGIDLSLKARGLGKIHEGLIFKTNPNKVPRVIGKEGSMIKLIKEQTNCNITVGQNGYIWIKGDKIDDELLAKRAIKFIVDNSFIEGLTEEVEKWFKKNGGNGQSSSKKARDVQEEVNAEVEAMEEENDN
jgi:exosome complex component RRP4